MLSAGVLSSASSWSRRLVVAVGAFGASGERGMLMSQNYKIFMVKMKSHIFKEYGIHYYLEVSIGKCKFIIDNFSCIYGYNEYRNRFKPKFINFCK